MKTPKEVAAALIKAQEQLEQLGDRLDVSRDESQRCPIGKCSACDDQRQREQDRRPS